MGGRPSPRWRCRLSRRPGRRRDDCAVFNGGHDMLRRAGVVLLGGHTVATRDQVRLCGDRRGRTRPHLDQRRRARRRRADPHQGRSAPASSARQSSSIAPRPGLAATAVASMRTLNRAAAEAVAGFDVHACTDITGFGLLGHASEMAAASAVSMEIDAGAVPLFDGVLELVGPNRSEASTAIGATSAAPSGPSQRAAGPGRPALRPPDLGRSPAGPIASGRAHRHRALLASGALAAQVGVVLPRREPLLTVR